LIQLSPSFGYTFFSYTVIAFIFKIQHLSTCYRADLVKVLFSFGHLAMVVEIMIIATVMVTQIPSGRCPLVVLQRMVMFHGTQRHAAQLWQLHIAVEHLGKNRYKVL
jgi:hypothetical protein